MQYCANTGKSQSVKAAFELFTQMAVAKHNKE